MDSALPQQQKPAGLGTTPRLTLSLTGWKKLSARIANWPVNAIALTIKREDDGLDKPCLFKWSPSDLILRLCSASSGEMREAPVVELQGPAPCYGPDSPGLLPRNGMDLIELWPGTETTLYGTLPDRYGPLLDVGGQYEILWAGCEITQWTWGTKQDHQGQDQIIPPGPKVILPAGPCFRFTALHPHWRPQNQNQNQNRPKPALIEPSARVPGAPVLTVTLKVDDGEIIGRGWDVELRLQTKFTYHGVLGDATAGPMMFYTGTAIEYESWVLLDRRRNGATWEPVTPVFPCNLDTLDAYDGDPWDFPPDLADGDVFRLQHRGCVIDWWSWGDSGDLATTLASFPSSNETTVAYPTYLDGRSKLVLPMSDPIELVYKEQS